MVYKSTHLSLLLVGMVWIVVTLTSDNRFALAMPRAAPVDLTPLENIGQIVAGGYHTCALTTSGGVKCWGENYDGQLGDGTIANRSTPVDVVGLSGGVTWVATGGYHTCALTTSGGIQCWGDNAYGQLGDGTSADSPAPLNVAGLSSGMAAVTVGADHTCGLTTGGGVKCWGDNAYGQLGDGTTTRRLTPVNVASLSSGVIAITAGSSYTCALISGGGVKCWGANLYGELGDGTTNSRRTPVNVMGLSSGVSAITAGGDHACAIVSSGGLKCWGSNSSGQLGDGTTNDSSTPVDVTGLGNGVRGVIGGFSHTCALTTSGGIKCWGENFHGQLGDLSPYQETPVDVVGLGSGLRSVAAGWNHSCALTSSSGARCWGDNSSGQLGGHSTVGRHISLDVVVLNSGIRNIVAGSSHTCVLRNVGGVRCWGDNADGQLGDGTLVQRSTPIDVLGLNSGVSAIAPGSFHTCVLTNSGGAKCWGHNAHGQLGDGTTTKRPTPADVHGLGNGVNAIAAGGLHTCALTNNSGIICWGSNTNGQLGDGTTTSHPMPVGVSGLSSGMRGVTAGFWHTCVLTSAGGVKCWGYNFDGQVGDGTTTDRLTPVNVKGLSSGVAAIIAGNDHTCALTINGEVKCWGKNFSGQLGDGTFTSRSTPVNVIGLGGGVSAVSGGGNHTCALTTDGGVKCWGYNARGQLGDSTTLESPTPVNVVGLSRGMGAVATGFLHTCAMTEEGGAKCWGDNKYGQLGDGTTTRQSLPVDVMLEACYRLAFSHTGNGGDPLATLANSTGCTTGQYVARELLTVNASPAPSWQVAGWSGTVNDASTAITNSIMMPAVDHAVSVTYGLICYALSLTRNGDGADLVASPTNSNGCPVGKYVPGAIISLTANPVTGWRVTGWSGTMDDTSTATLNSFIMAGTDHTVGIIYGQICYKLTPTRSGNGSEVQITPSNSASCSVNSYVFSETVNLGATPASGWQVIGWGGTIDDAATTVTNTLTMPPSDHTVGVNYGEIPISGPGDAYETDDVCTRGRSITTDDRVGQEHTFHAVADADWVHFTAISGQSYLIEVQVPVTSTADVNLEVYARCESPSFASWNANFSPGVRLDIQAPASGPIYMRLANQDATVAGATVRYTVVVRALNPDAGKRALILVAGRLKGTDSLQKNIHNVTHAVYKLFQANGYSDDNILYLSTDATLPGYDAAVSNESLRSAITIWAKEKVGSDGVLNLYLMDHGSPDLFYLDELSGQRLTPDELHSWLSELESAAPNIKINVFIEACQSGSFITQPGSISKAGRVVITSSNAENDAKASKEGAYFSDHLLTWLRQGYNLAAAFDEASSVARTIFSLQRAMLDADGNGIPNEYSDSTTAAKRSFAYAGSLGDEWAPHIFAANPVRAVSDQKVRLRVDVRDNKNVRQVWVVVYEPGYTPPPAGQILQPEVLPTFLFTRVDSDNHWEAEITGLSQPGVYRFVIHADDEQGLVATPVSLELAATVSVNEQSVYLPLVQK